MRGKATSSLLVHEQGHWDIAGLTAHEHYRALEALRRAGQPELARLAQETLGRIKTKADGLQAKYDRETNHSRDAAAQTRWDTLIRNSILNGNTPFPDP